MKFAISSSILSQRLQTLGRVIASKNSMPILDNFLFQVHNNQLELTASDSELTLHTTLELIESDGPIDFTVNAKTIQEAIKEIPEQPLEFNVDPDNLDITITYQNGHYNLVGQNAQEYPLTPELDGEISTLGADAARLFSGINRALFAAADDPLRPVMNGVFFDFNAEGLAVVASACSTSRPTPPPRSSSTRSRPTSCATSCRKKWATSPSASTVATPSSPLSATTSPAA